MSYDNRILLAILVLSVCSSLIAARTTAPIILKMLRDFPDIHLTMMITAMIGLISTGLWTWFAVRTEQWLIAAIILSNFVINRISSATIGALAKAQRKESEKK